MNDYNQGKDIYMELAKMYKPDMPYDELRKKYRGKCKTLVLAIHYGMGIDQLSHNLDMSLEEAQKLVDGYFTRYETAGKFIKEAKQYAKEHGEVRTIFGDKLRCDKRRYATAGINYVLQNG